jgi:hypothetical protein
MKLETTLHICPFKEQPPMLISHLFKISVVEKILSCDECVLYGFKSVTHDTCRRSRGDSPEVPDIAKVARLPSISQPFDERRMLDDSGDFGLQNPIEPLSRC